MAQISKSKEDSRAVEKVQSREIQPKIPDPPAIKPDTPPVPTEESKEGFFARWKRMREDKKRLQEVQESTKERIEAKAAEKIVAAKDKPSLESLDKINKELEYINKELKRIKI